MSPHVLVVVHESYAGLGRLGDVGGARLDERRPDLGHDLPQDLSGHDGLIVLGGSMAAWEDDVAAWLSPTRRLLAAAVERSVPTLAICLGAQLLALATGGTVERGAAGLEVGLVDVALTVAAADDALLAPVAERFGDRFAVPHWHQDAITRLPAGAVLLATGERYLNQAYRIGEAAWGLQYHPEVSAVDWWDWMEDGHGAVRTEGLHPDGLTAAMADAEAHLVALAEVHAAAFAQVLAAR